MEKVSAYEKMKALRSDTVFPASDISFKKIMFGGYMPKEVEEYIQTLKTNMQHSEKTFNDKIEEYASASNLFLQERDSLKQKINDCEKEMHILRAANLEIKQREEAVAQRSNTELEEALKLVESLQQQIADSEQNAEAIKEIVELQEKNKTLAAKSYELEEQKNELDLKNAALLTEFDRITKYNEKLTAEIDNLKKEISGLKIAKRNHIMNTNMCVYEFRQGQENGINSIVSSLNEIGGMVGAMKNNLSDLFEKTRTYLKEEDLADH